MEEWRWDGSIWDFAETIQWALVFRQLGKDKPAGWSAMVSDPKMIEQKANEYGITLRAVTDEMLRIGTALTNMYSIIDARNENRSSDEEIPAEEIAETDIDFGTSMTDDTDNG